MGETYFHTEISVWNVQMIKKKTCCGMFALLNSQAKTIFHDRAFIKKHYWWKCEVFTKKSLGRANEFFHFGSLILLKAFFYLPLLQHSSNSRSPRTHPNAPPRFNYAHPTQTSVPFQSYCEAESRNWIKPQHLMWIPACLHFLKDIIEMINKMAQV